MANRLIGLAAILACAGCVGGSSSGTLPTLPSGLPTGLQPGAYVLEVTGTDLVGTDPQVPGCSPTGQPPAGKRVTIAGTIARDGDDWIFTSNRPGTDLVLRLRVATRSFSTEIFAVDGSMRGTALDESTGVRAASGVTVNVGGTAAGQAAVVDGEIRLTGAFVTARATGRMAFSDTSDARATCNTVSVSLQPGRLG